MGGVAGRGVGRAAAMGLSCRETVRRSVNTPGRVCYNIYVVKVTAIIEVCSKLLIAVYNIQHIVLILPLGTMSCQ